MQNIEGMMTIKLIPEKKGSYSAFNVGTLNTNIGSFLIKHRGLDQYAEGAYEGVFTVSKFYQRTRKFGLGILIEPCADVEHIALNVVTDDKNDSIDIPSVFQSPEDEEEEQKELLNRPEKTETNKKKKPSSTNKAKNDENLEDLFGILWPLGKVVKLDSTVARTMQSKQVNYLSTNGYQFEPLKQEWHLQAA